MFGAFQPEKARRVHIRQVRADDQRRHGKAGGALQPRLPQHRADKAMCQIVHDFAG